MTRLATKHVMPVLAVAALMAMGSQQAWSQDRRPCVAPGGPSGCDSTLPDGPQPMTSFPGGAPSTQMRQRSTIQVPVEPSTPPPAPPPDGTVTLQPGQGGSAQPAPYAPATQGPQPAPPQ